MEVTRKMAEVVKIDKVVKHPNADTLSIASVRGWKVVIKTGSFSEGDLAIFVQIDAWVPREVAPYLCGEAVKEFNGVDGARVRTIKLRGQLSQGILLPITALILPFGDESVGQDVSEALHIQKWEAPIKVDSSMQSLGNFPSFVQKTDVERIQNCWDELPRMALCEISEKLDGQSCTLYFNDGHFGACSRNMELNLEESPSWTEMIQDQDLENKIREFCTEHSFNIAVQGERVGPGIQGNPLQLGKIDFYVFDIFNIDTGKYFDSIDTRVWCETWDVKHVPVLGTTFQIGDLTYDEVLAMGNGESKVTPGVKREGLVFKTDGHVTFKSISNEYLLKQDKRG